jgi:orotidine-5'-phosphate decarboxylase
MRDAMSIAGYSFLGISKRARCRNRADGCCGCRKANLNSFGFVDEHLFSRFERYIRAAALTGQKHQGNMTMSIFWPRGFQGDTVNKKNRFGREGRPGGGMAKNIPVDERIIFALDVSTAVEAKHWVQTLDSHIRFYKVGLQLFLGAGFDIVEWILQRNLKVFLDLKFFDVPATVKLAVAALADRGVSFTTVHGNDAMLRAAVEAARGIKILAVTALTSLDEGDMKDLGFECTVEDLVLSRARRALMVGCHGVISSGLEAPRLREELGNRFLVVTPGIRPVKNVDDQKRTVDVKEAFTNGADYIVVGRPLRDAADPVTVVDGMQRDIRTVLGET